MKNIRSILKQFGTLFVITGLLLGVLAVRSVFASFIPDTPVLARQKGAIGAIRIEQVKPQRSDSSEMAGALKDENPTATEVQNTKQPTMEATSTEEPAMEATSTEEPTMEATSTEEPGEELTPTPGGDNTGEDHDKKPGDVEQGKQDKVEFVGQISAINGNTWTIDGMTVVISDTTEVKGDARVGATVRVEGVKLSDGSVQAQEIKADSSGKSENHENKATSTPAATLTPASTTVPESSPTAESTQNGNGDHGGSNNGGQSGGDNGGGHSDGGHDGGSGGGNDENGHHG